MVLLSSIREKGGTTDRNHHNGETSYVSTAGLGMTLSRRKVRKHSAAPPAPPGVSFAKKIGARVFMASCLHYRHQCTFRITIWFLDQLCNQQKLSLPHIRKSEISIENYTACADLLIAPYGITHIGNLFCCGNLRDC